MSVFSICDYGARPDGVNCASAIQAAIDFGVAKRSEEHLLDEGHALFKDDDLRVNRVDIAIPIGLSYEFKGVTLDARYNFGLVKVFRCSDESIHNNSFVATLGYKF